VPDDEIASIDALGEEQDLRAALRRLMSVLGASFEQRAQLARALESRIVIEQAKGMLAERLRISLDEAFVLLRQTARSRRVRIHDLAREVLESPETPASLLATLQGTLLADDAS
jgi:AmiR/NasT family two-component response regulator